MSVVPVQMAGSIFLDSGWQSTLIPFISAFASVLVTWFIISKSTKEMKDLIDNNKSIEQMRIAASEQADWESALVENIAELNSYLLSYQYITRELNKLKTQEDTLLDGCYLNQKDLIVVQNIGRAHSMVMSRLSRTISSQLRLIDELNEYIDRGYKQRKSVNEGKGYYEIEEGKEFYWILQEALKSGKP